MTRFPSDLRFLAVLVLFVLMTGSAKAEEPYGRKLDEAALRSLAPGDYVGSYKDKLALQIHLKPDGKVSGTVDGERHRGKWRIRNGEICITVLVIILRKTKCSPVFYDGDRYFGMFNKSGKPRLVLRAASGSDS
jgi:hypothetical protein